MDQLVRLRDNGKCECGSFEIVNEVLFKEGYIILKGCCVGVGCNRQFEYMREYKQREVLNVKVSG